MTIRWNQDLSGQHLKIASSKSKRIAILAGPGTGKTSYGLLRRIMRLLQESEVLPEKILFLTFSRTAAEDFVSKLDTAEIEDFDKITASTVHSFCFGLLNEQNIFRLLGRHANRILMSYEEDIMLRDVSHEFGTLRDKRDLLQKFTNGWAQGIGDYPGTPTSEAEQKFQAEVLGWLRYHKAILIGEVVPLTYKYLTTNPTSSTLAKYSHIIIDEYQDLNRTEQELVEILVGEGGSICAAGDDDQSIYGFRCANPEGIRDFFYSAEESYKIDVCGRCPEPILAIANKLKEFMPQNEKEEMKCLDTKAQGNVNCIQWETTLDEAQGIAELLKNDIDQGHYEAGDFLVLVQSKPLGIDIRNAIREMDIKCHSFFHEDPVSNTEGEQALAILQLFVNPGDLVSLRYWFGSGSSTGNKSSYQKLKEFALSNDISIPEILEQAHLGEKTFTGISSILKRYEKLTNILANLKGKTPKDIVDLILPEGKEEYEDLRNIAQTYLPESGDMGVLLDAIFKSITQPEVPQDPDYVRVMSLHKSKGLTSKVVLIAAVVEGILPKQKSSELELEESRRLFFVGVTRAKSELILSSFASADYAILQRLRMDNGGFYKTLGDRKFYKSITSSFIADVKQVLPEFETGSSFLENRLND